MLLTLSPRYITETNLENIHSARSADRADAHEPGVEWDHGTTVVKRQPEASGRRVRVKGDADIERACGESGGVAVLLVCALTGRTRGCDAVAEHSIF